jgi:hypothetical protein
LLSNVRSGDASDQLKRAVLKSGSLWSPCRVFSLGIIVDLILLPPPVLEAQIRSYINKGQECRLFTGVPRQRWRKWSEMAARARSGRGVFVYKSGAHNFIVAAIALALLIQFVIL